MARVLFRKAQEIFHEARDWSAESTCLYQGAVAAQEDGDLDAALDLCRKALNLRKVIGDQLGQAKCLHQLLIIESKRGHAVAAERGARATLREAIRTGDRAVEAAALHRLAQVLAGTDRRVEAVRLLALGTDVLGDAFAPQLRVNLLSLHGQVLVELGREAEAIAPTIQATLVRREFPTLRGSELHWLYRERVALGKEAFECAIDDILGPPEARRLLEALSTMPGFSSAPDTSSRTTP